MLDPDPLEGWRLADRLSVDHAAMFIAEVDPADMRGDLVRYDKYKGYLAALQEAIRGNRLKADLAYPLYRQNPWDEDAPSSSLYVSVPADLPLEKLRGMPAPDPNKPIRLQDEPDWTRTTIEVEDLKAWLRSKRQFPAFFFPTEVPPDFMNPDDPRYSPKLACAVAAWEAVTGPAKSSVKQAIEDWVRKNWERFGGLDKEGKVPKAAVEEIGKVVNWVPEGGAPRAGGGQVPRTSPPLPLKPAQNYERLLQKPGKT